MKTIYTIPLLKIMLLAGCTVPDGIEEIPCSPIDMATTSEIQNRSALDVDDLKFEDVKNYLDQCGYDTTNLSEYENYFLINSDIGFYKERLAEEMAQTSPRMVYTSLLSKRFFRLNLNLIYFDYADVQFFPMPLKHGTKSTIVV